MKAQTVSPAHAQSKPISFQMFGAALEGEGEAREDAGHDHGSLRAGLPGGPPHGHNDATQRRNRELQPASVARRPRRAKGPLEILDNPGGRTTASAFAPAW